MGRVLFSQVPIVGAYNSGGPLVDCQQPAAILTYRQQALALHPWLYWPFDDSGVTTHDIANPAAIAGFSAWTGNYPGPPPNNGAVSATILQNQAGATKDGRTAFKWPVGAAAGTRVGITYAQNATPAWVNDLWTTILMRVKKPAPPAGSSAYQSFWGEQGQANSGREVRAVNVADGGGINVTYGFVGSDTGHDVPNVICDNNWHHLACNVFQTAALVRFVVYLDGVQVDDFTINHGNTSDQAIFIGVGYPGNQGQLSDCSIQDVIIYPDALAPLACSHLTGAQIAALAANLN